MESVKTQISDFIDKCEELKNCKFIVATTKIKDLLKSIVNSAQLYELFDTVASKFDYIAAKQRCFVEAPEGSFGRSYIILPDTVGDRLAFIFCLLVEFDRGDINFNAFLQKYYPKDGSYYASYHMFCDEVIDSLEKIICDVYAQELAEPAQLSQDMPARIPANTANAAASSLISSVSLLIARETDFIANSKIAEDDKQAAFSILNQLAEAVRSGDAKRISALTCGYNYFVVSTKLISESVSSLFSALDDYLAAL